MSPRKTPPDAASEQARWAALEVLQRRVDSLVSATAADITYGKALYREFGKHCTDDETRHKENVERLDSIVAVVTAQAEQLRVMNANLSAILPMLRRLRRREVFRQSVILCLRRWRLFVVGFGVSAAALYVWLDNHWPKIAALLRKIGGAP